MSGVPHPEDVPFGGVLVLVAIGRVLAVPLILFGLLREWKIFSKPGVWTLLTSPDSSNYHPLWSTAIVYEIGGKLVLLVLSLVLLWLFFARKKSFRIVMIVYLVATVVYLAGDHLIGGQIPAIRTTGAHNDYNLLLRSILSAVIWVPYFLISERVKQVFVR